MVLKTLNRYYTENAEDYWNRNYLDYSKRLDNIIVTKTINNTKGLID